MSLVPQHPSPAARTLPDPVPVASTSSSLTALHPHVQLAPSGTPYIGHPPTPTPRTARARVPLSHLVSSTGTTRPDDFQPQRDLVLTVASKGYRVDWVTQDDTHAQETVLRGPWTTVLAVVVDVDQSTTDPSATLSLSLAPIAPATTPRNYSLHFALSHPDYLSAESEKLKGIVRGWQQSSGGSLKAVISPLLALSPTDLRPTPKPPGFTPSDSSTWTSPFPPPVPPAVDETDYALARDKKKKKRKVSSLTPSASNPNLAVTGYGTGSSLAGGGDVGMMFVGEDGSGSVGTGAEASPAPSQHAVLMPLPALLPAAPVIPADPGPVPAPSTVAHHYNGGGYGANAVVSGSGGGGNPLDPSMPEGFDPLAPVGEDDEPLYWNDTGRQRRRSTLKIGEGGYADSLSGAGAGTGGRRGLEQDEEEKDGGEEEGRVSKKRRTSTGGSASTSSSLNKKRKRTSFVSAATSSNKGKIKKEPSSHSPPSRSPSPPPIASTSKAQAIGKGKAKAPTTATTMKKGQSPRQQQQQIQYPPPISLSAPPPPPPRRASSTSHSHHSPIPEEGTSPLTSLASSSSSPSPSPRTPPAHPLPPVSTSTAVEGGGSIGRAEMEMDAERQTVHYLYAYTAQLGAVVGQLSGEVEGLKRRVPEAEARSQKEEGEKKGEDGKEKGKREEGKEEEDEVVLGTQEARA
ncbi:hypothetical protein JCM8547_003036 [Rhodosporidiobolus lusitaniae]